jgi:hypothetical protein
MTQVERKGSGFVVPASLLAEAFGMTEDQIRQAMRDGSLTSTCEAGVDADAGRWRLTFRHTDRICRFTVDEAGTILARSRFPTRPRPPTASD